MSESAVRVNGHVYRHLDGEDARTCENCGRRQTNRVSARPCPDQPRVTLACEACDHTERWPLPDDRPADYRATCPGCGGHLRERQDVPDVPAEALLPPDRVRSR